MIIAALLACTLQAPPKKAPKDLKPVPVCVRVQLDNVPVTSLLNCELNVLPQLIAAQRLGPEWEVRATCYEERDA